MDGYIAEVKVFAGNFAPRNWAFCAGQLMAISSNTALFSLVGTIYGGDGRTTFALPDCRGRAVIGAGQGPGLPNYPEGAKGGNYETTLTVQNMPVHTHSATGTVEPEANNSTGNNPTPSGNYPAAQTPPNFPYNSSTDGSKLASSSVTVTVQNAGGSQPFNNMPPFIAMNWVICLSGIFPSRS